MRSEAFLTDVVSETEEKLSPRVNETALHLLAKLAPRKVFQSNCELDVMKF